MKHLYWVLILALALPLLRAEDLTTTDGKTYAAYSVVSHDDNGLSIWYKGGQATIPFDNLPADVQKQYGYKPKEIEWKTDYAASVKQAREEKKLLLLDFTGSDWCGYCQLLDKEVFPTASFRAFARAHFVCVTVDFPRQKTLPADLKQQNDKLSAQYKIGGFPSLVVTDADGKELGRATGYNPGSGPDHVISELKPFLGNPASVSAN